MVPLGQRSVRCAAIGAAAGRTSHHVTGSAPPALHGPQRASRRAARQVPRQAPYRCTHSIAYCEQDGVKMQLFGKNGPMATW
jgi:hypothetical protein